jgi:protein-S-isoprenylcysteine O-methyltransferase Ste14
MARDLNKARMRNSRRAVWLVVALYLVSDSWIPDDTPPHERLEYLGYFLTLVCAFGRVYSTAFLGGRKNHELMISGPFSIVRNPLYVFSLIGIVGVGLESARISILAPLLIMHIISYNFLVRREEVRLLENFGDAYRDYCARVKRFLPNFRNYTQPESMETRPQLLLIAIRDAWIWLLPYPIFEFIDWLRDDQHILPVLFIMP